ncbi:helicase [Seminavis robusta]|uniref:Helicase n=1 Tax=Seminavis robusta TaxID=568900 RepID=A0A9N8H6N9_9STRA|nr:helicase [Seminavis robusta]|eukprot:Sro105_g053270.1 helicase (333) ;mRNA; f:79756-80754
MTNLTEWEQHLEALKEYKAKHNDLIVPHAFVQGNIALGAWVATQRRYWSKGKLSQERIKDLEAMDFIWCPRTKRWNDRYEELKAFVREHKHMKPPRETPLETWIRNQRSRPESLSKEQTEKLDELGFEWGSKGRPPQAGSNNNKRKMEESSSPAGNNKMAKVGAESDQGRVPTKVIPNTEFNNVDALQKELAAVDEENLRLKKENSEWKMKDFRSQKTILKLQERATELTEELEQTNKRVAEENDAFKKNGDIPVQVAALQNLRRVDKASLEEAHARIDRLEALIRRQNSSRQQGSVNEAENEADKEDDKQDDKGDASENVGTAGQGPSLFL